MTTKSNFKLNGPTLAGNTKIQQFKNGFAANAAALGYEVDDIDAVLGAASAFNTAFNTAESAKVSSRYATQEKQDQYRSTAEVIRDYAQALKSNPLVTDEILEECGFEPSPAPAGPVVPPSDLTAKPQSDGMCLLKWKRNGNSTNTVYIVEAQIGSSSTWTVINAGTNLSYKDFDATPGIQRVYRVKARRRNVTSPASPSATIYPGGTSTTLSIAA